jgi:hypothetical protein
LIDAATKPYTIIGRAWYKAIERDGRNGVCFRQYFRRCWRCRSSILCVVVVVAVIVVFVVAVGFAVLVIHQLPNA